MAGRLAEARQKPSDYPSLLTEVWGEEVLRAEERFKHAGSYEEQAKKTNMQFMSMIKAYLKDEAWRHPYEREHPGATNDVLLCKVTARAPSPFSQCPH